MNLLEVTKNCAYLLLSTALITVLISIIVRLWMDLFTEFKKRKFRNVKVYRIDGVEQLKQLLYKIQSEDNDNESDISD